VNIEGADRERMITMGKKASKALNFSNTSFGSLVQNFSSVTSNLDAFKKAEVAPLVSNLLAAATAPSATFDSLFAAATQAIAALPASVQPVPAQVESFKEVAKVTYDTYLPVVKNAFSSIDVSDGISMAEVKVLGTTLSSEFDFLF
jgi:phage-related protein